MLRLPCSCPIALFITACTFPVFLILEPSSAAVRCASRLPAAILSHRRRLSLGRRLCLYCRAGGPGHILNLGHGVIQETPEEAVGIFVDEAKKFKYADIAAAGADGAREAVCV